MSNYVRRLTTRAPLNLTMPQIPTVKAPLWRRFAALLYDSLVLLALSFAYGALVTLLGTLLAPEAQRNYSPMFDAPWVFIGLIAVLAGFYLYFWRRAGQTIGMKTWRLKLVGQAPGKLRYSQLFVRIAIAVPGLALFGLGYFYRWFDARGDCLHDRLSATSVILLPKKH